MKYINLRIQGVWQAPSEINWKMPTVKHFIIELSRAKDRILRTAIGSSFGDGDPQ